MNCQSGQFGSHGLIEISVWLRLKAGGIAPTSFPKWEQPVSGSLAIEYQPRQTRMGQRQPGIGEFLVLVAVTTASRFIGTLNRGEWNSTRQG